MNYSVDERRAMCGPIVTPEGRGYACGARNRFATVMYHESGLQAEYAWETIERLRRWEAVPYALTEAGRAVL